MLARDMTGTCAECLEPITRRDVPVHARRHRVGTDHLFVAIIKANPQFIETKDCHLICREVRRHTPECIERQARRITDEQAQPTGDHTWEGHE